MRWLATLVAALAIALAVACGSDGGDNADETSPTALDGTPTPALSAFDRSIAAEADDDPSLPGEFVDLPAIFGGPYPFGTPPPHQDGPIDYSAQGLPPAGGLHWGPSPGWTGACPDDPAEAPLNCGPVPWGVYRSPWHAESLVHNMEHAGFVIWYNTPDEAVRDELEAFALQQSENDVLIVMAPFPDMAPDTVAITVWSRRLAMPADAVDLEAMQEFVDVLNCRFDPEGFC